MSNYLCLFTTLFLALVEEAIQLTFNRHKLNCECLYSVNDNVIVITKYIEWKTYCVNLFYVGHFICPYNILNILIYFRISLICPEFNRRYFVIRIDV